ncbi:MAG TPA: hypothetical protein VIN07_00715 [Flavipsychrobacter sp.]
MPVEKSNSVPLYDKLIAVLHTFYVDVRRRAVIFWACIILTPGIFILLNARNANIYNASFTVMYEELVRKVYGDRLAKLNLLLEVNKNKAQALLGLSERQINTLKKVEGTNILGEPLDKDLNVDRIPFIVNIYLDDTSYVQEIQAGILTYLENANSYLSSKRRLKMKEIDDEISFITDQLEMMDSQKRVYQGGMVSSTTTSSNTNEGSIYSLSYDLYKKKQELLKKKEMPMNLYVIDDAIVPTKSNRSYILVAAAGLFTGFIIYLVIVYLTLPVLRYKEA